MADKRQKKANSVDEDSFSDDILKGETFLDFYV
jgi:hypothetical protein